MLSIVRGLMDDRIVADQWGCDVPLPGSEYQDVQVDYQRPLFPEPPDLALPPTPLLSVSAWSGSPMSMAWIAACTQADREGRFVAGVAEASGTRGPSFAAATIRRASSSFTPGTMIN